MDINGDSPFSQNHLEDIDIFFFRCCFVQEIWNTLVKSCSILIRGNFSFTDLVECTWKYENVYNKLYHRSLEKVLVIAWSLWINRNNFYFKKVIFKWLILLIYLLVYCWDILVSRILGQDSGEYSQTKSKRKSQVELH